MIEGEAPSSRASRVSLLGIGRSFPGVRALDDVSLQVAPGEVVGIIGENGAGKSTLMKVLAGIERPDQGEIRVDGERHQFSSPIDALERGIALIHQELQVVDNLDAGSAMYLGREPSRFAMIDQEAIDRDAQVYLDRIGAGFSSRTPLSTLSPGQLQMVEIATAISREARILIMDEPTSSLSLRETEKLYAVVDELKNREVSVLYITHRLMEVERLADRVVGLRDGKNSGELQRSEINRSSMVSLMVGRELESRPQKNSELGPNRQPLRLQVERLVNQDHPDQPISFEVRAGEIIGIAGLVGAGRTELLESLFGVRRQLGGSVLIDGKRVRIGHPRDAMREGLALVSEDRKRHGLFLSASVGDNITAAKLDDLSSFFWIDSRAEKDLALEMSKKLRVKAPSVEHPVETLSGGNQQKVVIAKWVARNPKIMLLDEPTKGIDIASRHEIYSLMEEMAAQGMAVIFASSELEEIHLMADRVLVMHEGRLSGQLDRLHFSEEAIMELATGGQVSVAAPSSTDEPTNEVD